METLRDLLIQRSARLQGRPALTAPGWGTLSWAAWRGRVEGVAFGLLAEEPGPALFARTGTPWDWACEVAAACCGLRWEEGGAAVAEAVLGGPSFHRDAGREPYHDRERILYAGTPFLPGLAHGELLARLRRLNRDLGWDHETELGIPLAELPTAAARAALWSLLYAGGHARLEPERPRGEFDPAPFADLLAAPGRAG